MSSKRSFAQLVAAMVVCISAATVQAAVIVTVDRIPSERTSATSKFTTVPAPVADNLASHARFTLVDGERDPGSAALDALHDGKLARTNDDPANSFFFSERSVGGRIAIDLGTPKDIGELTTYSWHTATRAPQVYKVYVAEGTEEGFDPNPKLFIDPTAAGWTYLTAVDTRPAIGDTGGQYAVSIRDGDFPSLGKFRYVLFDISRAEGDDTFGNTFFSEINVIAKDKVQLIQSDQRPTTTRADEPYRVAIDTTNLSDSMKHWALTTLQPACELWYPKLVALLPGDHFTAARTFTIVFRTDMGGTPAYTVANHISCNLAWFEKNRDGQAVGAVIHEMVHVVQHYKFGHTGVPFWLQEGIPDYVRWYIYEPQSNGARIRDASKVKYSDAYRVSANFLNWATQTYDKNLIVQLNAALRAGTYTDAIWAGFTGGKTLDQLNAEWKKSLGGK